MASISNLYSKNTRGLDLRTGYAGENISDWHKIKRSWSSEKLFHPYSKLFQKAPEGKIRKTILLPDFLTRLRVDKTTFYVKHCSLALFCQLSYLIRAVPQIGSTTRKRKAAKI